MEEQRWLRQSEKDLESARDSLMAKHYEWACFQSQQTAEKALRAFLYSKGLRAILTHSIRDLVLDCSRYERDFHTLISQGRFWIPTIFLPDILTAWWATKFPLNITQRRMPASV